MKGSRIGWAFPIIVAITLIGVIWLGIDQARSSAEAAHHHTPTTFVE